MTKIMVLDWSKMAKQFSETHTENFVVSIRRAGKQGPDLQFSLLRILDTFQPFRLF